MAFVFPSFTVWPHCIHSIGPGYCFQQSGRVCFGHKCGSCKNDWTDRDSVFGGRLVDPRNVLDRLHNVATCRIRWISLCGGGDAACHYHYCSNLFFFIAEKWSFSNESAYLYCSHVLRLSAVVIYGIAVTFSVHWFHSLTKFVIGNNHICWNWKL